LVSPTALLIDATVAQAEGQPLAAPNETTLGHTTESGASTEACANIL